MGEPASMIPTFGASNGSGSQGSGSRRRNRTNYRCSKCGQPKRGHICPYQPRVIRNDGEAPPETRTTGVQVEIDARLVVRHLELESQGLPESYGEAPGSGPVDVAVRGPKLDEVGGPVNMQMSSDAPVAPVLFH